MNLQPFYINLGGKPATMFGYAEDKYAQTLQYQADENGLFERVLAGLAPGSVVYDIGANIGITSRLALDAGHRVFAFEPSPRARHALRINAAGASILPYGVGDVAGKNMIAEGEMLAGSTVGAHGQTEIEIVRLDDWRASSAAPKPDMVKIDVEGFERRVLAGATETLQGPIIIMEINPLCLDLIGRIPTSDLLDHIVQEWGGFVYVVDGQLRHVTDAVGVKEIVYRLFTSGKSWTDIVFGAGYERI